MTEYIKKVFYRIVSFFIRKANQYNLDYYKYLSSSRLIVGNNVRFRNNSSIVFLDNNAACLIKIGDRVEVRQHCIFTTFDAGRIVIGDDCFFNNGCSITSMGEIAIGQNCLFGEGIKIYDHNHLYRESTYIRDQGFATGKVQIGNNCWIGSNCVILNNVVIGDNVVIGANTLVYKSIPSNSVVRSSQSQIISVYR